MQPTGLNALAAIVAASPAQTGNANGADEGSSGQQFSQLLSDSGKQSEGQQTSQQSMSAKMVQASTASVLSAQEVATPAEQIAQLLAAREQLVTPDDAKDLLKRVDKIMTQSANPADTQALSQIKEQLQNIINTGTPKSIADILAAAPAVQEAKFSLVGLTALLTGKKIATQPTDQHEGEEEGATAAAVPPLVPVTLFRPDAGEATASASAAKSDAKKESVKKDANDDVTDSAATAATSSDTVTVLVPLAASITQPVIIASATPNTAISTDISVKDNAPPTALQPRSDFDQVIPPLTANDGNDDALPLVNLPKAGTIAEANATKSESNSFQALAAAAGATVDAKQSAHAQADLSALNAVPQSHGGVATQTVAAVQPVAVVQTPGIINYAPVSDQVSVAVTKASKDGIDHITIQLDPAGLGRVEVHMHMNREGQTQISFTVDKADTFDNLSRDARSLERSLQEAGIKADTGSMQFNMRQQTPQQMHSDMGNGQRPQQQANAQDNSGTTSNLSAASTATPTTTRNYLFNVREGVDISA